MGTDKKNDDVTSVLKGNYNPPAIEVPEDKKEDFGLSEKFEAEALKKLGGSITFVRKPGQKFVVGGEKKDEENKNE